MRYNCILVGVFPAGNNYTMYVSAITTLYVYYYNVVVNWKGKIKSGSAVAGVSIII